MTKRTIRVALREAASSWAAIAWDSVQRKTVAAIDGRNPRYRPPYPVTGQAAMMRLMEKRRDPWLGDPYYD